MNNKRQTQPTDRNKSFIGNRRRRRKLVVMRFKNKQRNVTLLAYVHFFLDGGLSVFHLLIFVSLSLIPCPTIAHSLYTFWTYDHQVLRTFSFAWIHFILFIWISYQMFSSILPTLRRQCRLPSHLAIYYRHCY